MTIQLRDDFPAEFELNKTPYIVVFDNFLTDQEISALKKVASTKFRQALVSGAKGGIQSKGRTGQNCWIPHRETPVIKKMCQRASELVGLPLNQAESLQMIHYGKSQEYKAHYDAWDPDTERGQRCMAKGGQRLVTCLFYLNDVAEGGGTGFPKLDLEIDAKRGRMVMFYNCIPYSTPRHPDSLHGGLPVVDGEKWACNLWFREGRLR